MTWLRKLLRETTRMRVIGLFVMPGAMSVHVIAAKGQGNEGGSGRSSDTVANSG
jgi:hypothetical protein